MLREFFENFSNQFLRKFVILVFLITKSNFVLSYTIKEYSRNPFGNVFFIRHAIAPGFGDPQNFDLNDCSTQRNLDQEGREQAIRIGEKIKKEGIRFTKIYSSQWCRCIETGKLMDIGKINPESGLNSFFQGIVSRKKTLSILRKRLRSLDDKKKYLMITHQVTITAITGITVSSGGAVAYNTNLGTSKEIKIFD